MKLQNKQKWQIIRQYIVGWSLALVFFSVVRGEGTQELGSVQFEVWKSILISLVGGVIFGAISGYAQILTEEHGYQKMSLRGLLVLRIIYVLLFLITMVSLAYLIFGEEITYLEFAFEPGSFAIYLYIVSVDIFMFGLRQVKLYFGGNNLWQLFSGRFYTPREEERIFMFLDLQSSTAHAERLGHIQYSKLIQDCFNDLGIVAENEADIYQYVGDEAILTWKLKAGLKSQNCLRAFFNFKQQLLKRKDYYTQNYNCLPHFKGGLHVGIVTVTEVGKYKKEIAYHGDTINTAARIQGQCNALQQELLISESLKGLLEDNGFTFKQMGNIALKGKERSIVLYGVKVG
ncbi:adenylate/guanylate cyclase domain-containing protein [Echinicola marina]|uniref:adenylate/guanylate cyclase domain-containing protein n=1 Tax=Echinicola marina TaxID=2859768 RepID=UPI001CF69687|nr:adenylate/guanylate cyclase domain-containing protein [Echinicola marina]UCS93910.1 adenylate/guanylate cyclase domain-containing protein [Echinicola marina]